jgi:Uma2 family endonuclease
MAQSAVKLLDDDEVVLRRTGVRFPIELRPAGFAPDDPSTWPDADGRLELVEGRLFYMPPSADMQQDVAVDVVYVLRSWSETHADFVVGGNEAGMKLGADIRAADAAVWRSADAGPSVGRLRHAPPILAVEVAGQDEDETVLRDKARWYLSRGVGVVWLVFPEMREVLVLASSSESRHGVGDHVPEHAELPGLSPLVARFFSQLDRG